MRMAVQVAWCLVALGAFILSVSVLKDAAGYVVAGLLALTWITWRQWNVKRPEDEPLEDDDPPKLKRPVL